MDKSTEKILKLVSEKDWTDYCVMRQRWYDDGREDTLRIDYLLDADSVVFDVGAYQGGWTADLLKRCGVIPAAVYLFEPVFEFHQTASKRFENTPQIKVLNFALSDRDGEAFIDVDGGSSSLHLSGETLTKTQDIVGFIQQERLAKIDLMSLNVEGHEYIVMNRLLNADLIGIFDGLQIPFHNFVPMAAQMRDNIRKRLNQTHEEIYCYPFVWEGWKRKGALL